MSLFQKIIYLIFLITISFEFENRKLTEIENLEIENIFDSMISSPSNPLNIILQTSNISDKEKLCPLCHLNIIMDDIWKVHFLENGCQQNIRIVTPSTTNASNFNK